VNDRLSIGECARRAGCAVVGPDVVIEIADPLAHVVVRSADDGTATTLLMSVRLD
jgi:hypothetical protein